MSSPPDKMSSVGQQIATISSLTGPRSLPNEAAAQAGSSNGGSCETTPRAVKLFKNQLYRVPQLQEAPKQRHPRTDLRNTLQEHIDEGALCLIGHTERKGVLPPFAQLHDPNSSDHSSAVSKSASSSSRADSHGSPLTPWDSDYHFPVDQATSIYSLRPKVCAFESPSSVTSCSQYKTSPGGVVTSAHNIWSSPGAVNPVFALEGLGRCNIGGSYAGAINASPCSPFRLPSPQSSPTPKKDRLAASPHHDTPGKAVENEDKQLSLTSPINSTASLVLRERGLASPMTGGIEAQSPPTSPFPVYEEPNIDQPMEEPPIWHERERLGSFKAQRVNMDGFDSTFEASYDVLGTLNPGHYCMPWGSRVVCIKSTSVNNIIQSMKNGIWATQEPVVLRIKALFESRRSEDERILLLFSVPGSKQFCGLAEIQKFDTNKLTDFWEGASVCEETMIIHWLFCKLVPYEEVRKQVGSICKADQATQMWNGMHYAEHIGREVIRGYVEYPHMENLLARPRSKTPSPKKLATRATPPSASSRQGGTSGRDGHRGNRVTRGGTPQRFGTRGGSSFARGDCSRGRGGASTPNTTKHGRQPLQHSASASSLTSGPEAAQQPRVQMMPVLVWADGTAALPKSAPLQSGFKGAQNDHPRDSPRPTRFESPQAHNFTPRQRGQNSAARGSALKPSPYLNNSTKSVDRGDLTQGGSASQKQTPSQLLTRSTESLSWQFDAHTSQSPYGRLSNPPGSAVPSQPMVLGDYSSSQSSFQDSVSDIYDIRDLGQEHGSFTQCSTQGSEFQSLSTPTNKSLSVTSTAATAEKPLQYSARSLPSLHARPQRIETSLGEIGEIGYATGHGKRGSKAKTSMDMRTDQWIDQLLESPSKEKDKDARSTISFTGVDRTTSAFTGFSNMSDK